MLDDFELFILLCHFFNDANASMSSTINNTIKLTMHPSLWHLYLLRVTRYPSILDAKFFFVG